MLNYNLLTTYGEKLDEKNILPEYPRPQLKRNSYINLNGEWSYAINKTGDLHEERTGKILVPFPLESALSKTYTDQPRILKKGEYLIYRRSFFIEHSFVRDITLLHIDAVDQAAEVFLNNILVGSIVGSYLPLVLDITKALKIGNNELVVRVRDDLSFDYPTGKQRKKRGGIWYTPISGIWQSVWLESVGSDYVKNIRFTPNIDTKTLSIEVDTIADTLGLEITYQGKPVVATTVFGTNTVVTFKDEDLHLWSPENPSLYDVKITTAKDKVTSYFAMRKFSAENGVFYLNNSPYFVNGLLDQGYFSDGIYTPASYRAYIDDIVSMKSLGFNTLRKHIKIEPMLFYHYCDTIGMLVFQDMLNVGKYSFFKDSVLPFSGCIKKPPLIVNVSRKKKQSFYLHSLATVDYLYSVPSVVYYTIFNEGWGQWDGDYMYTVLKRKDPSRVYDATSGWFFERFSDVHSNHIYFKKIKHPKRIKRPWIVSEFGGYSHSVEGHSFNLNGEFGYRIYNNRELFVKDFVKLFEDEVLFNIRHGLAGAIYTQVSDVEDETNGILTYDRKVLKLAPQDTKPIMDRIFEVYKKYHS